MANAPENSLYALAASNPVHEEPFYGGEAESWGTADDPVIGRRVGGTVVFGGGLALYTDQGKLVGGLGLSGDESCTDHVIAWKMRQAINLDNVPAGVTQANDDDIVHDLSRRAPISTAGTASTRRRNACRAPAAMVTRPAARRRPRSLRD